MDIEQAIYTHVKVRRDTYTMGFGYYSMTKGMERLLAESRELSAVSCSYIAPRNSECWWENNESNPKKRDELEKERIAAYHPEAFGYTLIKAGGKKLAAMTCGRNLGRDLTPLTRDGNILVNTLVLDPASLNGYPYEYYGSRELFTDMDREFFLEADNSPAPDLENPQSLTFGRTSPSSDEAAAFIEEEGRTERLLAMLGAVMDIADGGEIKRLLVCDKKENIISWLAALSIVYPPEIALKLTFKTYSFLGGNPDDLTPVYDNVIFCGVYSPTINGAPASSRATNYEFVTEWTNSSSAVVDLEQDSYAKPSDREPYFMAFVEGAFSTNIHTLEKYHDFIMLETNCRTLGHDYAKGYSYYAISRLKNMQSLKYLSDAVDFARRYMDGGAVKALIDIAFSCMDQCGCGGSGDCVIFGELAALTRECVSKGIITNEYAADLYMPQLMKCFAEDDIMHEDYLAKKKVASEFLEGAGGSFDKSFVEKMTPQGIMKMVSAPCKRWKLTEAAACVGALLSEDNYDDELANIFAALGIRLISSEKRDRAELIATLMGKLARDRCRANFLHEMYGIFDDEIRVRCDLAACMAELYMKTRDETLCGIMEEGELDKIFSECCESASGKRGLMLIYSAFDLARNRGGFSDEQLTVMIDDYFNIVCDIHGCYTFDRTIYERLLEMIASAEYPEDIIIGDLGNAVAVFYIDYYAEETDRKNMLLEPEQLRLVDFGDVEQRETNVCAKVMGRAFARRSIMLGSAVDVRYDLFLDCEDPNNEKLVARFFIEWMKAIAVSGEKKSAMLFGQVLAMAAADHRLDGAAIGNILAESDITPSEVEAALQSNTVMKYLNDTGSWDNALRAYLTGLMIRITDTYNAVRPKTGFEKLKSKLGGKKKK